jgi:hypothetical protein
MKLYRFEDVVAFYDRTQSYLSQHEAKQSLLLSFIQAIVKSPERCSDPHLALVEDKGEVVAIAIRPFPSISCCLSYPIYPPYNRS